MNWMSRQLVDKALIVLCDICEEIVKYLVFRNVWKHYCFKFCWLLYLGFHHASLLLWELSDRPGLDFAQSKDKTRRKYEPGKFGFECDSAQQGSLNKTIWQESSFSDRAADNKCLRIIISKRQHIGIFWKCQRSTYPRLTQLWVSRCCLCSTCNMTI